jgi:hypothetical protein
VEIEALLAHELAHIRRHDYVVNLIQTAFETLLFYHPAVWWLSREIRRERENCCDDLAVGACGDRVAYARTLAWIEERRMVPPTTAMAASGGSLLERVRRIAETPTASRGPGGTWVAAGAIALLAMAIILPLALGMGSMRSVDFNLKNPPGAYEKGVQMDHFVLVPYKDTHTFSFNGVRVPPRKLPENSPAKFDGSDREFAEHYAGALAIGDFEVLGDVWEMQDDLARRLGRQLAATFARTQKMRVEVVSVERFGEERLFACFLVRNAPALLGHLSAIPLFVPFARKEGNWRCPPLASRTIVDARRMGPDVMGRRNITASVISRRFAPEGATSRIAVMQIQRNAMRCLGRPPYNLDMCATLAEHLTKAIEGLKEQESLPTETAWRELLKQGGEGMLPKPGDFALSLYLEADKEEPQARAFPVVNTQERILVEPFPCLTDDVVRAAKVSDAQNNGRPQIEVMLTEYGERILTAITEQYTGKRLAIVANGKVISAPIIQSIVPGGRFVITGAFSNKEAKALASALNAYRKDLEKLIDSLGNEKAIQAFQNGPSDKQRHAETGQLRWAIPRYPDHRLAHGWVVFTEQNGEVRIEEHMGGGTSADPITESFDLMLSVRSEGGFVHAGTIRQWKDRKASVGCKVVYPNGSELLIRDAATIAGLTTDHQVLCRADFVKAGQVIKSMAYVARLSPIAESYDGFGRHEMARVTAAILRDSSARWGEPSKGVSKNGIAGWPR